MNASGTQLIRENFPERIPATPESGVADKRILIVEGQAVGSPFKDTVLQQQHFILAGYAVNGKDAVHDALSLQPDLILMDVHLPGGMSGVEAACIIQSRVRIPIIFMSAAEENCLFEIMAGQNNAYGYIRKPFNTDELLLRIKIALSRFEMETKLLENAKKFQMVFEQETDAYVLVDNVSRTIADVNNAMVNLFGYSRQELVGQDLLLFMDSHTCDSLYGAFEDHSTGEPFIFLRQELHSKNGTSIPVACRGRIIDIEEKHYLFCSFRDITEKIANEEKDALLQAQLLHSDKMASIGVLAMGIAHEINNPLAFILSNLQTLDKYLKKIGQFTGFLTEKLDLCSTDAGSAEVQKVKEADNIDYVMQDALDLASESTSGAERIQKIVKDLMLFTRSDNAEPELFDVHSCIENTISIIWNELKYKVQLKKNYGDIPRVQGYQQKFSQVMMNLLVNAAHAIEKESVITIKTWCEEPDMFVSIADRGCGIVEENLEKIFEPFFTTKEPGKGTGLGLSIVYDIVTKKLNGTISVKSRLGEGTTFTVRLPLEYTPPN